MTGKGAEARTYLFQLSGKQALHLGGQDTRAEPVGKGKGELLETISLSDLALPLICHMIAWVRETHSLFPSFP